MSTQLFKEYALADMSRYKEGKIGLRWRTEREVIAGKVRHSAQGVIEARTIEFMNAVTDATHDSRVLVPRTEWFTGAVHVR